MTPELRQRVAVAWNAVQALGGAEADRYLRELRRSDPEVAGELEALLGARGPGHHEQATLSAAERPPEASPHRPDDHNQAPYGEPTISKNVEVTASWMQSSQESSRDTGPIQRPTTGQILGRFQLLHIVGRGGFGEVWQAYDPALQKHVAVKVPLPGNPGRPSPPATFLHEARKAASLRHPAIVQVYDVGESADGWYIVTEFIEGDSLRAHLEAGRLPFAQCAGVIATVAGALHAAHLAGLVHRDVKPANILLDRAGNAYLTDFGLAVREEEQRAERGEVSGTLAYMSPEQIRGDTHLMDGRADIYALGAVLYELLTRRPLFRAENIDEYRELILRREPRPPRSIDDTIPEELERICLKCLAKEVRDRYTTAQDLANDLNAWLANGARSPDPPPGKAAPVPGWLKAAVAGALVLSVLGGAVGVAVLTGALNGSRPLPTPSGPVSEPTGSADRGRKVPAVKELVWPRGRPLCKWEILPETNQLKIYTDSTALLQLGETDTDSWEFTATLRQLANVGRIGLFLGYRKDPRTSTAVFELLQLVVAGDKVYLQRSLETYRYDEPFAPINGRTYASVPIKGLLPANTLQLRIRGNQLSEVRFNSVELPGLSNAPLRSPAAGAFGVFNRNSDGVLSNLLLNDRPIPLLVNESPRTPEKP